LPVQIQGLQVGTIARSRALQDALLFDYSDEAQAQHAVSLTMPVVPDQYDSMMALHPVFEMNLPEGALRERLTLMFAKLTPGFDDLELLRVVGASQIGRLRYGDAAALALDVPVQNLQALLSFKGAEDLFADLVTRYAHFSGLSGVQPKVLLRAEPSADLPAWFERMTDKGATHIVKAFDAKVYPELAANEYFCMRAAAHAGLNVAKVSLASNRKVLVVDRFDLTEQGQYLAFEDFCVLSAMRSSGRYNASYEDLALRVGQFVSPNYLLRAYEQLLGSVMLACVIGNGDAHLKNFGVLYEHYGSPVCMAPVYDMLSTCVYEPRDVMALALAGSKAWPTKATLFGFGRVACQLSSTQVRQVHERVLAGVELAGFEVVQYAQAHPDFATAAQRLQAMFAKGLQTYR
jgi:serine/threonine-protein kinase HipA